MKRILKYYETKIINVFLVIYIYVLYIYVYICKYINIYIKLDKLDKLDKMLINYFDNSSMLSIYQKKILKSHDGKDLLSSKFSDKCKKGFPAKF